MSSVPRWTVQTPSLMPHNVGAKECRVVGEVLVFLDADGKVLRAYAPGEWRTVERQ